MTVFRLSLHVLAATIWVGGQLVLAGLVPTLRAVGPDAPRLAARRFNLLAWPAFFVLFVTGIWNLMIEEDIRHPLFEIKFLMVIISGAGAAIHIVAKDSKAALAIGGAMASLGAVAALVLGVALAN